MKTIFTSSIPSRVLTVLVLGLASLVLSGCSTIQFVQHEQAAQSDTINRWHHSTLNGMVEISKPLNVQKVCENKAWTTITTEFTFYNALPVILVPTTPLVSFYSAWTNKVGCYQTSIIEASEASSE